MNHINKGVVISMKKKRILSVLAIGAASLMVIASLTACGGSSGGSSSSASDAGSSAEGSYSSLADGKAAAQKYIAEYEKGKSAASFQFADGAYAKAKEAAEKVTADSSADDVKKVVTDLALESLTITDEKGDVTVSYPEGDAGKNLKELPDRAIFNKVVKGISDKFMKDPEYNAKENTYSILAGVRKGDEGGVAIVGYNDEGYASVIGGDIAEKCGSNTVVLNDGKVVGSTLEGVALGASLDEMGVKESDLKNDSFSLKAGDKSYNAAAVTKGSLTVIVSVPA